VFSVVCIFGVLTKNAKAKLRNLKVDLLHVLTGAVAFCLNVGGAFAGAACWAGSNGLSAILFHSFWGV